ncbi:MAG: hypothetical protein RLZZ352_749 [Pseudomonadota bacterium]|jgi:hypothetical protein
MRKAPSVIYPVGPCAFYAGSLLVLGLLSLAVLVWWWGQGDTGVQSLLPGLGWLAWAVLAWRSWVHAPVGHLQWDAQHTDQPGEWRWHRQQGQSDFGAGMPMPWVQVVFDGQSLLLLRLRNPDGAWLWLWLERHRDPARWMDLRRALRQP